MGRELSLEARPAIIGAPDHGFRRKALADWVNLPVTHNARQVGLRQAQAIGHTLTYAKQ